MAQIGLSFSLPMAFAKLELHLRRAHGRHRDRYQRIRGSRLQPEERFGTNPDGPSRGTLSADLERADPTRDRNDPASNSSPGLGKGRRSLPTGREFTGSVDADAFALITDPDDRKFAALS